MAVIYYPTSTTMIRQDTVNTGYTQLFITNQPNTIMVFDSGSNLSILSASLFYLTASNSVTSSYSNYSATSSFALNAGGIGTASYVSQSNVKIEGGGLYILGTLGTWFQVTVSEDITGSGILTLS